MRNWIDRVMSMPCDQSLGCKVNAFTVFFHSLRYGW